MGREYHLACLRTVMMHLALGEKGRARTNIHAPKYRIGDNPNHAYDIKLSPVHAAVDIHLHFMH